MILDLSSFFGGSLQSFYEDRLGESITIADLYDAKEVIEEWVGKNQHAAAGTQQVAEANSIQQKLSGE